MPEQREQEISRLRARVAPVQANLLTLLDARPKQPGICFGEQLASMYKATFGEALDPEKLTGQSDLKAMLTAEKADAVSELRRSEGTSRSCGSMLRRARPGDVDLLRSTVVRRRA